MIIGYCLPFLLFISYCILILLVISYCILIHTGICILWCRTTMRPARLVSYAFLYTTHLSPFIMLRFYLKTETKVIENCLILSCHQRPCLEEV